MPSGEEVDRRARDDLVGPQRDREDRVQQAGHAARGEPDQDPAHPRAGDVRPPGAEERADQHHALEADVHDARALGRDAAERGEGQRRRIAQRGGQQRRPDDDALEVPDARLRRPVGAGHADHAGHDGGPADPLLPRADGDRREAQAGQGQDHRRDQRPDEDRRQREVERDQAEGDAAPAHPRLARDGREPRAQARPAGAARAGRRRRRRVDGRAHGGPPPAPVITSGLGIGFCRRRRRPRESIVTSTGADTNSTIRPWMM